MFLCESPYWSKPPRDGYWGPHKRLTVNVISDGITRLPVLEGEISHIEIPRVSTNLGITIVGGVDTALRCIVVQEVFPDGLVAQDGRLRPGDQIIEINGTDTTNASHHQVCQLLRKTSPVLRLGVYRETIEGYHSGNYTEELHDIRIESGKELGIRLSGTWRNKGGVYVTEVANHNHKLQLYDRIVNINGQDVSHEKMDYVSQLIQNNERMTLVVGRMVKCKNIEDKQESSWQCKLDQQQNGQHNNSMLERNDNCYWDETDNSSLYLDQDNISIKNNILDCVLLQQKTITVVKEANESLGMRIGGGLGSNEGDIPIYIANIHPQGCIGQTQQVWKGDILLNVNGTSLLSLTHSQAVATLKATVETCVVTLGLLEGPETCLGAQNFIPSWLYWQKLPRCLQFPKTVTLKRSPGASLGFSIVGGMDPIRGIQPIHILFVVQQSPAAKYGKLKCGDRLLAVNGQSLENVNHSTAVSMLKSTSTSVTLELVSWLGTEL